MYKSFLTFLIVLVLLGSACSVVNLNSNAVQGSGKVVSQDRGLSGFTRIELQSSAQVEVTLGDADSVVVSADDNLQPLIQTRVQLGRLIISAPPNTSITTMHAVRVVVTMQSLDGISLPGSGSIKVSGMQGNALKIDLPGSGDITVLGTANQVNITLSGSGQVDCDGLPVQSASVTISGSGNVTVNASQSLDAVISGSGDIRYHGNPAKVNQKVTGSGSIHP